MSTRDAVVFLVLAVPTVAAVLVGAWAVLVVALDDFGPR